MNLLIPEPLIPAPLIPAPFVWNVLSVILWKNVALELQALTDKGTMTYFLTSLYLVTRINRLLAVFVHLTALTFFFNGHNT